MFREIIINPGRDKNNQQEPYEKICIPCSSTVSIVGPTGSGKTSFINDIELIAKGDTDTERKIEFILNSGEVFVSSNLTKDKPVVLITQNTKCISDLIVSEFISIHARSRGNINKDIVEQCLNLANQFTGEKIERDYHITSLSGGQTRSLLIADAILISDSPILILDEIENAGINKALIMDLIKKGKKMVFFVTHDPVVALNTDVRIIMKNGAIQKLLTKTETEKILHEKLKKIDNYYSELREKIRNGLSISSDLPYEKILSGEECQV